MQSILTPAMALKMIRHAIINAQKILMSSKLTDIHIVDLVVAREWGLSALHCPIAELQTHTAEAI